MHWLDLQRAFYPDDFLLAGFGLPNRLLDEARLWHEKPDATKILADLYPYRNITPHDTGHVEYVYSAYYGGYITGLNELSVVEACCGLIESPSAIRYLPNQLFVISESLENNERIFVA